MTQPEITLLRDAGGKIPSGMYPRALPLSVLREEIAQGRWIAHFLRYRCARLYTYRIDLLNRPFAMALLLRLLSHGECVFQDETGREECVGVKILAKLLSRFFLDTVSKHRVLREAAAEVESLIRRKTQSTLEKVLSLSASPLYLRTDLVYGLQSGGSVGHIAGVVNHLGRFTGPPILVTTDRIPTVDESVETHILRPLGRFRDFRELPSIEFNQDLDQRVVQVLGSRRPGFVYQRYCLNNFAGLKVAHHYRIPFVLEYNGSEVWINRNWGNALKYEELSARIESLNLAAADLILVVSKAIQDELVGRGIGERKILVNPNGVNPARYTPAVNGTAVRRRYGLEGKTVLGFIGTFGRWHGAEVLAEAFGQLLQAHPQHRDTVRLLMIGDGVMMPEVRRRLAKSGAEASTILTGLIAQEQGPEHLAACDILVSPHVPNPDGTPFFGSPTKLFEYMAMGKGIVASDLDQIGEVLRHDMTALLVKPADVKSLCEGLIVLIEDKSRRERLGVNARMDVVSRFTWEAHTGRIIQKLTELCRSGN
jgi:glycosyltransferase involved in cell wall biosynthesis